MRKTIQIVANNSDDITDALVVYAREIGLEQVCNGRFSLLLAMQLHEAQITRKQNPHRAIERIRSLEYPEAVGNSMKPPTPFKRPPLKGLMHAHYFLDGIASLRQNLLMGLARNGLPGLDMQAPDAGGEPKLLTQADCARIAHDAVIGNFERRAEKKQMTGEWIIYATHESGNIYLALGTHTEGDASIRQRIDAVCCIEFPFLHDLLVPESANS